VAILICSLCVTTSCGDGPTVDHEGNVHGSGELIYKYDNGAIKLREIYKNGNLIKSTWYKPDGSELATTIWENGSGVGYYLRDDGSVKSKIPYKNGLAEGIATYFDSTGKVERTAQFERGKMIGDGNPGTEK
jgi:antitoxin component YwqK of YwqJK toxin-antitoxin module